MDGIRFKFTQSIIHKEYLDWLYNYMSSRGYCNPKTIPYEQTVIIRGKKYIRYQFSTYTFKNLKWLNKLFYKKGRKYINPSISEYLTPLALAVWIMDDGGKLFNAGLKFSTNCFTYDENCILRDLLIEKYQLKCVIREVKVNNNIQYNLYILKQSMPTLISIVKPYMIHSMYHKLYDKSSGFIS